MGMIASAVKLVAVRGPQRGSIFDVPEGRLQIGRESVNDLEVLDLAASRQHCVIERNGTHLVLKDLGSANGTRVNGSPVEKRELSEGDEISIGDSVFAVFLERSDTTPVPLRSAASATVRIALNPALPDDLRATRDLRNLIHLTNRLACAANDAAIIRLLLDAALSATAARRAVFLAPDPEAPGRFSCELCFDGSHWVPDSYELSAEVLDGLHRSLAPLLVRSSDGEEVLAVPLLDNGRLCGAVYADSPHQPFDPGHVGWAAAAAEIAALALASLRRFMVVASENKRLRAEAELQHSMIGDSPPMREVYRRIAKIAPSHSTVLVLGESGTGKELAARAIHQNSPRHRAPFVAVNCALLSESLLESELFGHEKGAFTGAFLQKKGKIETAEGGTLFLDELGEIALPVQAKLLRFLQEREFERLGGTKLLHADVRIIGATHKDLSEMAEKGGFRHDLMFRLKVVAVSMPPLRDRREDIPALVRYLLERAGQRNARRVEAADPEVIQILQRYPWPGNVRELENVIEHALVMGEGPILLPADLPEVLFETGGGTTSSNYFEQLNGAKREIVRAALAQFNGNYTRAAAHLGVNRTYLHRLAKTLEI